MTHQKARRNTDVWHRSPTGNTVARSRRLPSNVSNLIDEVIALLKLTFKSLFNTSVGLQVLKFKKLRYTLQEALFLGRPHARSQNVWIP